jgi:UDP-N-acetyl-D-mannosaminuronate dehydrogenase
LSVSSSAEVRSKKITVVALGKIGLPLAVQFASKGHDVVGLDVNPDVVDLVNRGAEPFPGEAGLAGLLDDVVHRRLHATTEYGKAVLLVAVGRKPSRRVRLPDAGRHRVAGHGCRGYA